MGRGAHARGGAMTEIWLVALKSHESGCRRTGTLFRFSFWDGRLGQTDLTQKRQGAKPRSGHGN